MICRFLIRLLINSIILYYILRVSLRHFDEQYIGQALWVFIPLLSLLYLFWKPSLPYGTQLKLLVTVSLIIWFGSREIFTAIAFNSFASLVLEVQNFYPPPLKPDISLSSFLLLWSLLLCAVFILLLALVIKYSHGGLFGPPLE